MGELKRFVRGGSQKKEPVDVNSVVRAVLDLSRHLIQSASAEVSLDLAESIPTVTADFVGLEQVVLNLVENACLALPGPGRRIVVTTRCDPAHGDIVLQVVDEGTGIPSDDLARITQPFFTTRSERGGTGLGLSVASRIIQGHGGTLSFESAVGVGTTATVRLPSRVGLARSDFSSP